jgi:hypothetical protein
VFGSRLSYNDNALLNLSVVSSYLMQILTPIPEIRPYPSICGDSIMPLTPTIQGYIRNPDIIEGMRSRWMNSCRMCNEHSYSQLFNLFHIMIHSELHQIFYNGVHIFHLGIVCFFLQNCYVCFNGSTASSAFKNFVSPSFIAEYLPLDVDFEPYHPVELTGVYNYG